MCSSPRHDQTNETAPLMLAPLRCERDAAHNSTWEDTRQYSTPSYLPVRQQCRTADHHARVLRRCACSFTVRISDDCAAVGDGNRCYAALLAHLPLQQLDGFVFIDRVVFQGVRPLFK